VAVTLTAKSENAQNRKELKAFEFAKTSRNVRSRISWFQFRGRLTRRTFERSRRTDWNLLWKVEGFGTVQ